MAPSLTTEGVTRQPVSVARKVAEPPNPVHHARPMMWVIDVTVDVGNHRVRGVMPGERTNSGYGADFFLADAARYALAVKINVLLEISQSATAERNGGGRTDTIFPARNKSNIPSCNTSV